MNPLEVIVDPHAPTIVTRRWFAAPPDRVWACWTRADLLRQWMGPRHLECLSYDVDLRVGRGWRFVHRAPDGQEFAFHGTYHEIEPPRRLVGTFVFELFPDHEVLDTLTLAAHEGGTLATTHSVHSSIAARDAHLASGMEAGMAEGYARLDTLLGTPEAPRVVPFLWFQEGAEAAVRHYIAVLGDGRVLEAGGSSCSFELAGQRYIAFNGGPHFRFTEAVSMMVSCDTQDEVDRVWAGLLEGGGTPSQCGWLKDRWGLSWQVVPRVLPTLLSHPDRAVAQRVMNAMFGMRKLDIAGLLSASEG